MPEVFRMFGMRFFFYSLEHLPIHIHVRSADGEAKFEIEPSIRLVTSTGMKTKDLVLAEALVDQHKDLIIENGTTFTETVNTFQAMKIEHIWFDEANIYVVLDTGHTIGNPLSWFTRLENASPEQRLHFELGSGQSSVHWEDLGEDLSLESFFDFKRELNYARI